MAERQLAANWEEIREDHRGRYIFASERVSGSVIDAGCGCGYGTHYLASSQDDLQVLGIDLSETALAYARQTWAHPMASYMQGDISAFDGPAADWVLAFEVLEHLPGQKPVEALERFAKMAPRLIASVPNQAMLPFNPARFPYHHRHYTPGEFRELLTSAGWRVDEAYAQPGPFSEAVVKGTAGRTLVYVCTRA